MKRQPKWIAALFAILLALCGIYQNVGAQTAPAEIRTYYTYDETYTLSIVLRLKEQGQVFAVYGAMTRGEPELPLVYEITGTFFPNQQLLRANIQAPPGRRSIPGTLKGTVDGTFHGAVDSFDLVFNYKVEDKMQPLLEIRNVQRHTGAPPIVLGIWRWEASPGGPIVTQPPAYAGEFYILTQNDFHFTGQFSESTAADAGLIKDGQISAAGANFTRTSSAKYPFPEQKWGGQVAATEESIQGAITVGDPSNPSWQGAFTARSIPLQ